MPLHPQSEAFLQALALSDGPGWHELTPTEAREVFDSLVDLFGDGPDVASVSDHTIGDVPVRVYSPNTSTDSPAIVYFHGGGWVLGNIESHDALCRRLCNASQAKVISVEYRRPPEDRYPAAVDDCYLVTQHVLNHASELGIDSNKVIVAGDSAGGNLALAVTLKCRDENVPQTAGQILIYPVVEPIFDSESYLKFGDEYGLTRSAMMWFWDHYLEKLENGEATEYATLLSSDSLKSLPPTHVMLAEYDVLNSEGQALIERLKDSGVTVTSKQYDGQLHGFVHFAAAFDSHAEAMTDVADVVKSMTE